MMNWIILCCGILFCIYEVRAAARSPRQQAVGEIKQSCIEKAQRGKCDFYVCFEERHPCERDNYAIDYAWRFCSRFEANSHRLSHAGRRWFNGSKLCTMTRLLNYYREDSIVCSELAKTMKDAQASCEVENGLCSGSLLRDNREVFTDVHNIGVRSATQFLHAVKHCTLSKARMVAAWFRDRFEDFAALPAIQDLRNGITGLGNAIARKFRKIAIFFKTNHDDDDDDDDDWTAWEEAGGNGIEFDIE